jgi:hypothetical protein
VALKSSASTQILKDHKVIQSFELEGPSVDDRSNRSRQDNNPVYWESLATDPSNKAEVSQTREWLDKMVKRKTIVCELKEFPEPATSADWDNCNTVGHYALRLDKAGVEEAKGQLGIQLSRRAGNRLTTEVQ